MVEEGQAAPLFALESDEGETTSLESLRGKPGFLYFYPRDDMAASATARASGLCHPKISASVSRASSSGTG